jgi:hypothetical protein
MLVVYLEKGGMKSEALSTFYSAELLLRSGYKQ